MILLEHYWWGSVFLLTLPLAVIALVMAVMLVPSHVNETTEPVDHLGGVLSIVLVGALILGINFAAVPGETALVLGLFAVAGAGLVAFYFRQRRAANPLYDLHAAARPTFWVAACAGRWLVDSRRRRSRRTVWPDLRCISSPPEFT